MTQLGDILQQYASGLTRPEPGQEGWKVYVADDGVDFAYAPSFGPTADRPVGVPAGWEYYDTDLSASFVWDGSVWNGASGTATSITWDGPLTLTADTAPADGSLLKRVGTTIVGVLESTLAGVASAIGLKFGATTRALSSTAPTTGQVLAYDGTNIVGLAQASITSGACSGNAATATTAAACSGNAATATTAAACSGNAATATTAAACSGNAATATTAAACSGNAATATLATSASGLKCADTTVLTMTTPATTELLQRSGTTIVGVAASTLTVSSAASATVATSATGLKFNATVQACSTTAPTTNQRLQYDGTNIVGVTNTPACTVAAAASNSTTAINFTADRRTTWNGSGACALTANLTGAIDGTTVTVYFPANQVSSITVDTTLAPTAAYALANFDVTVKMVLVMQYFTTGIITTCYRVS